MLKPSDPIGSRSGEKPQLIVVVDTEEEFDWSKDPDVNSTSVNAIRYLHRVQDIFDEYNISPCYVVDYPIASQSESIDVLASIAAEGRCEIGAHLHPWVNPPFEEQINRSNMYPGNLTYELEYEKLAQLTGAIKTALDITPIVYKAGRYGVGPNTSEILRKLGYEIDLSICPAFDYREDGGPDFSDCDASPYWIDDEKSMLEIPLSGAFVGCAGKLSKYLYSAAGKLNRLKVRGILSRLNVVDRLMLSPEGYGPQEHRKLTKFLFRRGVRTFTWNFHSPTVVPGMTMYTNSNRELEEFLDSFRRYFDFFFNELNGIATTPIRLKRQLELQQ